MKIIYLIAILVSLLVTLVLQFSLGSTLSFSFSQSILEQIVSVSAFVFAVTGIWLGISNTALLQSLFKSGYSKKSNHGEVEKFNNMFSPLRVSMTNISCAFVLMLIIFALDAMLTGDIKLEKEAVELLSDISKFCVSVLVITLLTSQLYAIHLTLIPAREIVKNAKLSADKNTTDASRSSRMTKASTRTQDEFKDS